MILSISLILVCLPRFNRVDIGIDHLKTAGIQAKKKLVDVRQYINYTNFFKGQSEKFQVKAPFSYRPLLPFVASKLPFNAMTSINIINIVSLLFAMLILFRILNLYDIDFKYCLLGCSLFVFSFPTFYYGAVGMTEPLLF